MEPSSNPHPPTQSFLSSQTQHQGDPEEFAQQLLRGRKHDWYHRQMLGLNTANSGLKHYQPQSRDLRGLDAKNQKSKENPLKQAKERCLYNKSFWGKKRQSTLSLMPRWRNNTSNTMNNNDDKAAQKEREEPPESKLKNIEICD